MSPWESASWIPKHTSSNSIEYPIVATGIHMQDIHQVISNPIFNPTWRNLKEQDSIHHNKIERGKIHHMIQLYQQSSRYIKIMPNQEHERERDIKHIATSTYPQPRGWTTPSSAWPPSGWWRWPPDDDFPLQQGTRKAPDWFFVDTESCGAERRVSLYFWGFWDL